MELAHKDSILKEIPLFAGLSLRERNIIAERCAFKEFRKDEIIYAEGSPASFFYCVISGRVVIYTTGPYGQKTVLEYLHRGRYFGIISLLTSEPHSVTAAAINDCLLLVIEKNDFAFILEKIPKLAIDLSRTLSRRLKNKDIHQKTIFESTILSVFSLYSQAGKTIYALNLSLSLYKETHKSVVILDICHKEKMHSLPQKLGVKDEYDSFDLSAGCAVNPGLIEEYILKTPQGIDLFCFYYEKENDSCLRRLVDILSLLVNDYHYIILDLPSSIDGFVFSALNQSDLIHILSSPEEIYLKRTSNLMKRLKKDFHFPEDKIKVIVNEYKFSKLTPHEQTQILGGNIFATLPKIEFCSSDMIVLDSPDCEYAKAIRRISRQLGDCLVGLALGVGFAYGFCHIGVLKVIEEEKIPIDVISGSSIGALIAALWATGRSSADIMEIAREFKEPKYVWGMVDLTLPFLGFVKGQKLYNFLKRHFGDKTFRDVRLPLKIIASDIRRKESRVLDQGLLIDAIMMSCSMPGVFRPYRLKEDMLLDGGVINPLPTEVLFNMGVKKIIAVNVTPSRDDILSHYEKIKAQFTTAYDAIHKRKWFSLKQYIKNKLRINILDIIFSSVELMQSELAQKEAGLADIVLHPDTSGIHWLELHRAAEFSRRGEEEARRNLDKIWQVVNE